MYNSDLHDPLQFIKETISELAQTQEGFVLPPYVNAHDTYIPDELKKMGISSREIYDVISDFDMSPVDLTKTKRELRKKYLQILLNLMNNEQIKTLLFSKKMSPSSSIQAQMMNMPNPFAGMTPPPSLQAQVMEPMEQVMNIPNPFAGMTPPPALQDKSIMFEKNFDASLNTIKRIIKLLIMEITEYNSKTAYIGAIAVLSIILVIMIIVSIICFSRSMR